jgi:hypothetical protein
MKLCGFENKTVVVEAGSTIKCVYFIRSGEVRVSKESGQTGPISKRIPDLAVSILSVGKILGEQDILNGSGKYSSSYKACSDCMLYEMPLENYLKALETPSPEYAAAVSVGKDMKKTGFERANRALVSIRNLMTHYSDDLFLKESLIKVLPTIIDTDYTGSRSSTALQSGMVFAGKEAESSPITSPHDPLNNIKRSMNLVSPRVLKSQNMHVSKI